MQRFISYRVSREIKLSDDAENSTVVSSAGSKKLNNYRNYDNSNSVVAAVASDVVLEDK